MSPADKKHRMDRFFAAHRDSGLPVTTQRRAIFEAILTAPTTPLPSSSTAPSPANCPRFHA